MAVRKKFVPDADGVAVAEALVSLDAALEALPPEATDATEAPAALVEALVSLDAALEALPPEVAEATEAPAALDPEPADKKFVMVRATSGYMFEPFQRIPLMAGQPTPVELTSWVECQIDAGHIERC